MYHPTSVILHCKETTDVQVSEGADEQETPNTEL